MTSIHASRITPHAELAIGVRFGVRDHLATGQRCYCLSSSKSATSSATTDTQAAAQDNARVQTGSDNVQLSDGSISVSGGEVVGGSKFGSIGSGSTVNITSNATELAAQFAGALTEVTSQAGNLLGATIKSQSDLSKEELKTFTDATHAVKTGLSQTTIALGVLAVAGVAGVYLYTRKR